jgi:hypothetical protein
MLQCDFTDLLMNAQLVLTRFSYIIFWLSGLHSATGHPISVSSVIVDVQDREVRVEMQIMAEDLVLYHKLQADGKFVFASNDLQAAAEKHQQFVLDYFSILDGEGERLKGEITEKDFAQISNGGVAQTELMQRLITFTMRFPLPSEKPRFLTFIQTFGGPKAVVPAVMDFYIALKDSLAEPPTQLNYGRPHTVRFDWNKVGSDKPKTIQELRKQRAEQFQERLGISTYSGLYSFIYLTRYEVRHEILIPLLTLEQWLPIPRKDPDYLSVEEQAAARESIEGFFQKNNKVQINAQAVSAKLARLNFFGLNINDFALNADPRRVSVHQARVGVILSFPCPASPQAVEVSWSRFTDAAPFLRSIVLIENNAPAEHYFNSKTTDYFWRGDLKSPEVVPVKATRVDITSEAGKADLQQLIANVYRAFDFRDDSDVYDALATSVKGELLRDLYLRIKRSLLVAEQGGALSQVSSIEIRSIEHDTKSRDKEMLVQWQVTGTTEHWGHIHTRTSEYRARMKITAIDGELKLERYQVLDEKQIRFETSIRGYDSN